MEEKLRHVTELSEALELAPAIDAYVVQAMNEFQDEPLPEGVCRRFFESRFQAPETLVLVLESAKRKVDLGVCVTGPFEDPLLATRTPMILLLFVSPSVRHRGYARRLVDEAGRMLAARGFAKVAARAGHNDDALISLGERWGFVRQWEHMLRE